MTCIKCRSTDTKSSRTSHPLGWITEIVCPDCGTTQTTYDHEPGKGQQLSGSVVQAAKAENFTMDDVISFGHGSGKKLGHQKKEDTPSFEVK